MLGDDGRPVPVGSAAMAGAIGGGGGEASSFIDARGQARGNDQYSIGGGGSFGGQSNSIGGTPIQNEVLDVIKRNDADTVRCCCCVCFSMLFCCVLVGVGQFILMCFFRLDRFFFLAFVSMS